MKTRIISAIFMLAIALPAIIVGGLFFKILAYAILLLACYEICSVKKQKLDVLLFVIVTLFSLLITISLRFIPLYLIAIFTLLIIKEEYSLPDLAIVFTISLLTTLGLVMAMNCYSVHNTFILYVAGVSLICDAAAYFSGYFFGKRKFFERISPKKTVEGAIGGLIVSILFGVIFSAFFNFYDLGLLKMIIITIVLPFVSIIGDLSFSLIKRYYGIKDYGKLIPGHGGVLDRLDSVLFCLLFIGFILGI